MSTIKSSDEHLTLNADGSSKDIKFQANGVEKASISSAGVIATNGASLDGAVTINESGADVDFRVESDTDTHSLFVDGASGTVGIGVIPEHFYSTIKPLRVGDTGALFNRNDNNVLYLSQNMYIESSNSANPTYIENDEASWYLMAAGAHKFYTAAAGTGTISSTKVLEITADSRGLSQFTAKAWVSLNQQGTQYIKDSHNVSSITDYGVGDTHVTFSNAMANANYSCMTGGRLAVNWDENLQTSNPSTTQISLRNHIGSNGTGTDSQHVSCVIFGD